MTPEKPRRRPGPAKTDLPTIHDVAEAAGVSAATVSRALRNPEVVSSSTRARVAAAARELGYQPGPSIKPKGNKILALIPRLGSPFFTPFLDAASYAKGVPTVKGASDVIADLGSKIGQLKSTDPKSILDTTQKNLEALLK